MFRFILSKVLKHSLNTTRYRQELASKISDKGRIKTRNLSVAEAFGSHSVEKGVLPLVVALNKHPDCSTIASCEGHGKPPSFVLPGTVVQNPYVLFKIPQEAAKRLSLILEEATHDQHLSYYWRLHGYFHPSDRELVWLLEICDFRIPDRWDRHLINKDFEKLAHLVSLIGDARQISTN